MSKCASSIVLSLVFCLLVAGGVALQLKRSYDEALHNTTLHLQNNSYLIGEWIKGALQSSDFVLRDIAGHAEIVAPAIVSPHQHVEMIDWLENKRATVPGTSLIGLFDHDCVLRQASAPHLQGDVETELRDSCALLQAKPDAEFVVAPHFITRTGRYDIVQVRRIGPLGEPSLGFVAMTIDASMLSNLLRNIEVGADVVAIFDTNMRLIDRKPALPNLVGKRLISDELQGFAAKEEKSIRSFRSKSLLDGQDMLSVVLKLGYLPIVVMSSEADETWLANWRSRIWEVGGAALLLVSIAGLLLRDYWQQLASAERLEQDLVVRKRYEDELRQARDTAEAFNAALRAANDELSHLATTDVLTGAWNRRYFEKAVGEQVAQKRRYGGPLSMLLLDIDHFKSINDRYGHQAGDRVLIEIVRLMRDNLRETDLLARWGGEEFVVLTPRCDAAKALGLAEKLRTIIAAWPFSEVGRVTSSFGVTAFKDGELPKETFKRADNALYMAKAAGRDNVQLDV